MRKRRILSALISAVMAVGCMAYMPQTEVFEQMTVEASYSGQSQYGDYLFYKKVDDDEDGTYDYVEITNCDPSVTEIEIPSEIDDLPVTSIGYFVFYNCTSLTNIEVSENNAYYSSIDGVLFNKEQTELIVYPASKSDISYTIPNTITKLSHDAFGECENLTSITISNNIEEITKWRFKDCNNLTSINASEDNNHYSSINGVLFNKEQTELIAYPNGKNETSYIVPEKVTIIKYHAFYNCINLTSIELSESLESIGEDAFANCTSLKNIEFYKKVIDFGISAFYNTPWLKAKQLENPLVIINNVLIDAGTCEGVIEIPSTVNKILRSAFYFCDTITEVSIPDSITVIDAYSFSNCTKLEKVKLPKNLTAIYKSTFAATGLKNVEIPYSVTEVSYYSFGICPQLESITFLNPACEIYDSSATISNRRDTEYDDITTNYFYDGIIYGYDNSTAQVYAEKYGYTFKSLGEAPVTQIANGDANGDGEVSVRDASTIARFLAEKRAGELPLSADFNGDGEVNVRDAAAIAKALAKGEL